MTSGDLVTWNGKQRPESELFAVACEPSGRVRWERSVRLRGDDFFVVVNVVGDKVLTAFCPRDGSYVVHDPANLRSL